MTKYNDIEMEIRNPGPALRALMATGEVSKETVAEAIVADVGGTMREYHMHFNCYSDFFKDVYGFRPRGNQFPSPLRAVEAMIATGETSCDYEDYSALDRYLRSLPPEEVEELGFILE